MIKQILTAAAMTAGVAEQAQACADAVHNPANKDMAITMNMVPHKDIISPLMRTVTHSGKVKTWEKGKREPTVKSTGLRCASTALTYEFIFNEEVWKPEKKDIHLSLDPNYEASPDSPRGCVTIPATDLVIQPMTDFHEGKPGELRFAFNRDATDEQKNRIEEFTNIVDSSNRNNEYWCMTIKLNGLTIP